MTTVVATTDIRVEVSYVQFPHYCPLPISTFLQLESQQRRSLSPLLNFYPTYIQQQQQTSIGGRISVHLQISATFSVRLLLLLLLPANHYVAGHMSILLRLLDGLHCLSAAVVVYR